MFGLDVLEVGIGMALLFLFMSPIATALREIVERVFKHRAKDLKRGIEELLKSEAEVQAFFQHPLIASLYKGSYSATHRNLPSYIPRQNFALAILDITAKASETGNPLSITTLQAALKGSTTPGATPNAVQRVVLTALGVAESDLNRVRAEIEDWYDGSMDRVSGWYVRRTGWILGGIGLFAAIFFNVDAIVIARSLLDDDKLRAAVVARAEQTLPSGELADPPQVPPSPATSQTATTGAATAALVEAPSNPVSPDATAVPPPAIPPALPADAQPSLTAPAPSPLPKTVPPARSAGTETQTPAATAGFQELRRLKGELDAIGLPIGWTFLAKDALREDGRFFDYDIIPTPQACTLSAVGETDSSSVTDCDRSWWPIIRAIPGWIITALAVMLGAPFWFDVMNKFMVIRSTIKPKEKSPDEPAVDGRPRQQQAVPTTATGGTPA